MFSRAQDSDGIFVNPKKAAKENTGLNLDSLKNEKYAEMNHRTHEYSKWKQEHKARERKPIRLKFKTQRPKTKLVDSSRSETSSFQFIEEV